MTIIPRYTLLTTATLFIVGCDTDHIENVCQTERKIRAGEIFGGEFVPIHDGSSLEIVRGVQAGLWAMPTVRCGGCLEEGTITAAIDLVSGVHVSDIRVKLRPTPLPNGDMEVEYLRIPIAPNEETAQMYYDQKATFRLGYMDSCSTVESEWTIILRKGNI